MTPRSSAIAVLSSVALLLAGGPDLTAASALRDAGEAVREDDDDRADHRDHDDDHGHHHHHHVGHARHHHHHGSSLGADLVVGLGLGLHFLSTPAYRERPYDHRDFTGSSDEWDRTPVWNGSLTLLGGGDGDDLGWVGGEARAMSPIGLGLGSEWLRYREGLGDETVTADLADVSLVWRVLELPAVMWDVDVGWLGWHDEVGTEHGAHIGTRLTVFPWRPLVATAGASGGGVGEASVERYHLSAGVVFDRWSLAAGYRWVDIETVDLDGWELRASFWF